ncbi:MAG: universal stress protein [Hyphomicrobiaceae bacterium]
MKSILVPIEDHSAINSVVRTASLASTLLQAFVVAVPLRAMQFQVVGAEPIVAVSFPPAEQDDESTVRATRTLFDEILKSEKICLDRMSWSESGPIDDIGLGTLARVYDLTVVGRPEPHEGGPRMTTLESVLFDGGRPVLIASPKAPKDLGRNIVISWNRSIEAARTVAFALPLLKHAKSVSVLTIEEAVAPGPDGSALVENLAHHEIAANDLTLSAKGRKPGAAILEEAANLGADLLVKGAYTQSRLRQMIFGGATSHILAHAELPVFMAN